MSDGCYYYGGLFDIPCCSLLFISSFIIQGALGAPNADMTAASNELVVALLRSQCAQASRVGRGASLSSAWTSALSVLSSSPHAVTSHHHLDAVTPLYALAAISSASSESGETLVPSALRSSSSTVHYDVGAAPLRRYLLATSLMACALQRPSTDKRDDWVRLADWRALMCVMEGAARYRLDVQRQKDILDRLVCDASVCMSARELHCMQWVLLCMPPGVNADAAAMSASVLVAHALCIASQVQLLRRSNAVECLRLWELHRTLLRASPIRSSRSFDELTTFLLARVIEYVTEACGAPRSAEDKSRRRYKAGCLKSSTWDAVAALCTSVVPHRLPIASASGMRQALRLWMRQVRQSSDPAVLSSGCRKALSLSAEVVTLLPPHGEGNHHALPPVALGRALLLAYHGFTQHPASRFCLGSSLTPMDNQSLCTGRPLTAWAHLQEVLLAYKYHTAQTPAQRHARLQCMMDAVATTLPLVATLSSSEWDALRRVAVLAASASPILAHRMVLRVFGVLDEISCETATFDRTAMLHGLQELLGVLLPVVPFKQLLPVLWRLEICPATILSDLATPREEWVGMIHLLGSEMHDELPLSEIVHLFENVQGEVAGAKRAEKDNNPMLYPLSLLSLLVLDRCVSLSVMASDSCGLLHVRDVDAFVTLAGKFSPLESGSNTQAGSFSCGGCVHRLAILKSMCQRLMGAASKHRTNAMLRSQLKEIATRKLEGTTSSSIEGTGGGDATVRHSSITSPLSVRDVNLELSGRWVQHTVASVALTVARWSLIPSSPHRFRYLLMRLLGGDGAAAVPALHAVHALAPTDKVQTQCAAAAGVRRLFDLWAGSVSILWDTQVAAAAAGLHGRNGATDASRLMRLMQSENCRYHDVPDESSHDEHLAPPLSEAPSLITAWIGALHSSGLLELYRHPPVELRIDELYDWIMNSSTNADLYDASALLILRHIFRSVDPAAVRNLVSALDARHRVKHDHPASFELLLSSSLIGREESAIMVAARCTELQTAGSIGSSLSRCLRFEYLLDCLVPSSGSATSSFGDIERYTEMVQLLEEESVDTHDDGGVVATPHDWEEQQPLLRLSPRHIPDSVHCRFFAALQHYGKWEIAVSMVRRCKSIHVRHHHDATRSVNVGRSSQLLYRRGARANFFLPSAVLGSLAVVCRSANVDVPDDVRASLLQ